MKAKVTEDCIVCGLCVDVCSEVFEMGDQFAQVKMDDIPEEFEKAVRQAADECPVSAIVIEQWPGLATSRNICAWPDKNHQNEKLCYAFFQRALIRSAQNRLFWAEIGFASPLSKKYHKKELNLKNYLDLRYGTAILPLSSCFPRLNFRGGKCYHSRFPTCIR